jgi:hypothetical protein
MTSFIRVRCSRFRSADTMVARAERCGPPSLSGGHPRREFAADGAARGPVCNVAASMADEQLRAQLRESFGYSNPYLSGTLDSLDA